ncbi:hypothetical protein B0H14DRAFT_2922167 [Mycena olivaceomarginata]|nr:hypothetical protein B0H14DRAFT_2922167 [Mycena olivaceomarginata]
MPPAASKAISKAVGTFFEYFCIILCYPCLCAIVACGSEHLPVKEQPQSCYLLSRLPLELRQCIFEQVLSGRLIDLHVVDAAPRDVAPAVASKLSPALLHSCHQIYAEALPILHQCNTFSFYALQLKVLVCCRLGEYCLPDIHSVYDEPSSEWRDVFVLLHRMGLEHMVFELKAEPEMEELNLCIDYSWAHHVLKLRNLRQLELWLYYYDAEEDTELVERLRGRTRIPPTCRMTA